jgi:hypothetical protein
MRREPRFPPGRGSVFRDSATVRALTVAVESRAWPAAGSTERTWTCLIRASKWRCERRELVHVGPDLKIDRETVVSGPSAHPMLLTAEAQESQSYV